MDVPDVYCPICDIKNTLNNIVQGIYSFKCGNCKLLWPIIVFDEHGDIGFKDKRVSYYEVTGNQLSNILAQDI